MESMSVLNIKHALSNEPKFYISTPEQEKESITISNKVYSNQEIRLKRASDSQSHIKMTKQNMEKILKCCKKQSVFRLNSHADMTDTYGLKKRVNSIQNILKIPSPNLRIKEGGKCKSKAVSPKSSDTSHGSLSASKCIYHMKR